jgi:hypothetical protein
VPPSREAIDSRAHDPNLIPADRERDPPPDEGRKIVSRDAGKDARIYVIRLLQIPLRHFPKVHGFVIRMLIDPELEGNIAQRPA